MTNFLNCDEGVAISYFTYYQDKFLASSLGKEARNDRSIYRIVAITCLYLALKLIGGAKKGNISTKAFSELIGGAVSEEDLAHCEIEILFGLGWLVNPPAEVEYVEMLLDLVPCQVDSDSRLPLKDHQCVGDVSTFEDVLTWSECRSRIFDLAHCQIKVKQKELVLSRISSSCIASAAILNACQGIIMNKDLSSSHAHCRVCINVITDAIETCSLADEEELENARAVLINLSADINKGFIEEQETFSRLKSSDIQTGPGSSLSCRTKVHEIDSASPISVLSRLRIH